VAKSQTKPGDTIAVQTMAAGLVGNRGFRAVINKYGVVKTDIA